MGETKAHCSIGPGSDSNQNTNLTGGRRTRQLQLQPITENMLVEGLFVDKEHQITKSFLRKTNDVKISYKALGV